MFSIREIFYTLQGEGANAGRAAVFVRFAGCNYWTGLESGRGTGERCSSWCDTDFVTDVQKAHEDELLWFIEKTWGGGGRRFVVFTGGEPALQLTSSLITQCRRMGFDVAVETNGSTALPEGQFWITVSPKVEAVRLSVTRGNELKLVYDCGLNPADYLSMDFRHHFLQPLDGNTSNAETADYCLRHPEWRLSIQQHKLIGLR